MSQAKRLSETEKMAIVREAADGVSSSELAKRFGVTSRAVRYVVKADAVNGGVKTCQLGGAKVGQLVPRLGG